MGSIRAKQADWVVGLEGGTMKEGVSLLGGMHCTLHSSSVSEGVLDEMVEEGASVHGNIHHDFA